MTPVMRHDGCMEENTERLRKRPEPADPDQEAGSDNPEVPPASETWVEGQPTSDADYGGEERKAE